MRKLKKIGTSLLAAATLLGIGLAFPTVASADPPPWAPAYGYHKKHHHAVKYSYVYYPAAQVYYNPVRRVYYYPYSGGWRSGVVLPPTISLGNSVNISLGGPVPYVYHPTVI